MIAAHCPFFYLCCFFFCSVLALFLPSFARGGGGLYFAVVGGSYLRPWAARIFGGRFSSLLLVFYFWRNLGIGFPGISSSPVVRNFRLRSFPIEYNSMFCFFVYVFVSLPVRFAILFIGSTFSSGFSLSFVFFVFLF